MDEGILEAAVEMLNAQPLPSDVQVWDGEIHKMRRDAKGEYREVDGDGN